MTSSRIRILGFDPAYKSIGWCVLDLYLEAFAPDSAASPLVIVDMNVVDLLPNKNIAESTERERAAALRALLNHLVARYGVPDHVAIERQAVAGGGHIMSTKSAVIMNQIIYHFAELSEICLIAPAAKNKLSIGGVKCADAADYRARKKHTKAMLPIVLQKLRSAHLMCRAEYADDMADAMFTAMLCAQKLFPTKSRK